MRSSSAPILGEKEGLVCNISIPTAIPAALVLYTAVSSAFHRCILPRSAPTGCAEPTPHQASAFAAWEMRLYLNTHPNDESALQMFEQICRQTHQPNYACTFAPCVHNGCWTWIQDPWPWELEANEGRA